MIQLIGLIVSVYAAARLVTLPHFLPRNPDGSPPAQARGVTGVCWLAAVVIALLAAALLLPSGQPQPPLPHLDVRR